MRPALLLVPALLTLIGTDSWRTTPARMPDVMLQAPERLSADTGENSRQPSTAARSDGANRDTMRVRQFGAAPRPECPMPVDRPDPSSFLPMPTARSLTPRSRAITSDSAPPASGSSMPIIRSGCWNPLDQPKGERDSAWIEGDPRH